MSFEFSGLSPALLRAVSERGYLEPTAIQAAAIPAILKGADVLGCAQTGSGKTAAFALPILQHVASSQGRGHRVQALVLVPTRDLAAQVGEAFRHFAQYLPTRLKIAVVFGGVSINPQMMGLRGGADIVVATPGRLLDLIDHNALSLRDVGTLVLDEADRLLDLGFAEELSRILTALPARCQNLFFSATFPQAVQGLADRLLDDPVRIEVPTEPETRPAIQQRAIEVDKARRTPLLRHLIQQEGWSRVLVFVSTKYATELLTHKLNLAGINTHPFHGELSQGARSQVLADFKASRAQVVVATDVAARGLDVAGLPAVVNYDLPRSPADHVHRIGRTGRAGQSGVAVSFITADDEAHFRVIEKRQGLRVPREQLPGFERTELATPVIDANGGVKGKRPSKKDKLRAAAARAAAGGPSSSS